MAAHSNPDSRAEPLPGLAAELAVFAAVALVYALLATYGSLEFVGEEKLNRAYDYLGESFLQGEATVPTNAESLRVDGRDYIYFGPLPALLRLPLNALWPDNFGLWGRIATLGGALLALAAWLRIVRVAAPGLGNATRVLLGLGFGLGTPVAFLVSSPYIWHESMVIALAASLWALAFWLDATVGRRLGPGTWLGLGCAISVAYLTRVTFSAPHLAIVAGLYACAFAGPKLVRGLYDADLSLAMRKRANAACLLVPIACAVAFQSWYNVERFGSPLVYTSHASLLAYAVNPELLAHHDEIGTFNPARVPTNLRHYFGDLGRFDTTPPFAHMQANQGMGDDLYLPGYREWNISLWFASGWLVVGAVLGLAGLVRRRRGIELAMALAFSCQLAVVLSYYFVSQRFTAELLPGLCLLFACFLATAPGAGRRAWRIGIALLIALSIPITLASTLSWQAEFNWGAPDEFRAELQQRFSP